MPCGFVIAIPRLFDDPGVLLNAARRLRQNGHAIRVIADRAMRAEVEAAGGHFVAWKDALAANTHEAMAAFEFEHPFQNEIFYPVAAYATDIQDELCRAPADAILSIDILFGAVLAAEVTGIPIALLSSKRDSQLSLGDRPVDIFPRQSNTTTGQPQTPEASDKPLDFLNKCLPTLNAARVKLGLTGLSDALSIFDRADRILFTRGQGFDSWMGRHPENARFIEPLQDAHMDNPAEAEAASSGLVYEMETIAAAGRRFRTDSYTDGADARPYKLYIPTAYDSHKVPLIVMLHGCLQSPNDFAAGTRMNVLAERVGCLVCYPGQVISANAGKCWNWFEVANQQRDRGEPALIAGITRKVMAEYAVDPRRIYIGGLSAGGAMAATTGYLYPELYAAIGVHSGLACGVAHNLDSALAVMKQGSGLLERNHIISTAVPTIVFHGSLDAVVNPINGDELTGQLLQVAPVKSKIKDAATVQRYKSIRFVDNVGHSIAEQWTFQDVGHAWSGGSKAGSFTDPNGPDASVEMLRFFLDHPRPIHACAP